MALPFLSQKAKRPEQVLALDLGRRSIKGVLVHRKNESYALQRYVLRDVPATDKAGDAAALSGHLKAILHSLGVKPKAFALALGVDDSILKHAELPLMLPHDLRLTLMTPAGAKKFLQDDLSGYLYDCFPLPKVLPKPGTAVPPPKTPPSSVSRFLVGGARRSQVETLLAAAKTAGLPASHIAPGAIGPMNAFEFAQKDAFEKEIVALIDIGYRNSAITIVMNRELAFHRPITNGGDRITQAVAETLNITPEEAEGIKIGLAEDEHVQSAIRSVISSIGMEFRASIDFFEHQNDKTVSQVYVSGGSARSEFILQTLQEYLMVPCKVWNPLSFMTMSVPADQVADLDHIAPQLAVAVGAAMSVF